MSDHVRLALVIASYTAKRISEILNIKWKHIQGDYREIFIPQSKTKKKRSVPIHPELAKILSSAEREGGYVIQRQGNNVKSIKTAFNLARTNAKRDYPHIHDFRHRAITRCIQLSMPTFCNHGKAFAGPNLRSGAAQVLVGRKTEPLPYITYEDFMSCGAEEEPKNVERVWKAV